MDTDRMLKEIFENPEKEFINRFERKVKLDGSLMTESGNEVIINRSFMNMQWEEAKKPLTLIEALQGIEEDNGDIYESEHKELFTSNGKIRIRDKRSVPQPTVRSIVIPNEWYPKSI